MKPATLALTFTVLSLAAVPSGPSAQSMLDPADVENVLPGTDGFRLYQAGWDVFIDESRGTCLIERSGLEDTVIQMGLSADGNFGYVGIFRQDRPTFEDGALLPVTIEVGDDVFFGTAVAVSENLRDDYTGGYVVTQDVQFFEDIARQFEMVIRVPEVEPIVISLSGTLHAIEEALKCNEELGG